MTSAFERSSSGERHYGVYPAIVTDIVDTQGLGQVELKFLWLGDTAGGAEVRAWATLATPYADDNQGFLVYPAVGSQVLVAFEAGDLRHPYVLGACWNGRASVPERASASNDIRVWKTRSGSKLEFDDTQGLEKITVATDSGHSVVLDNATQSITITHMSGSVIRFTAAGAIEINANTTIELTAPAMNVHAATATFDGIISCQTLQTNVSVCSPAYTPGAGNFW